VIRGLLIALIVTAGVWLFAVVALALVGKRSAAKELAMFLPNLLLLFGGLAVIKQLDRFWILARRAAGHDQRQGVIGRVFGTTAVIGAIGFTIWLLFIGGLGSTLAPR